MKKITIIAVAIFIVVTSLSLATNLIHWDETPLEQSIAALPLGLGLLLELPLLILAAILTGNGSGAGLISYDWHSEMMQAMPFMTGALYAGLFYLIAHLAQRSSKRWAENEHNVTGYSHRKTN